MSEKLIRVDYRAGNGRYGRFEKAGGVRIWVCAASDRPRRPKIGPRPMEPYFFLTYSTRRTKWCMTLRSPEKLIFFEKLENLAGRDL